ncbi:beta strand repeat-containing protein, partial [Brevibacillus sp. SYSU BS000544]|uniref:beta strand repeat-containing protein n=1 Tax=Brevibacillus sp. SYSU BS000544 TaxID=3416443 RepID=UPI003CE5822F
MKRKQVVDTLLQGKVNQQLLSFVFFIALLFVFTPTTAHAATFLVDSIIDAGDAIPGDGICASNVPFSQKCTVRAAIMEANASVGSDTIIVPVGTYVLRLAGQNEDDSATGDLDVLDELTIIGANGDPNADPSLTKIQAGDGPGQGVERVIAINPKMEKAFNATLRSLTIRYGTHSAVNSWDKGGGGVYWEASDNGGNAGSLTISNCVISDNTTSDGDGGGIALFNSSGSAIAMATIDKTVVKNNQANGVGGGIFIGMNTPINLLNSEVSTNRSNDTSLFRGDGGGIYIANNTLAANANIKNSTISNNRAENSSGKGGGIYTLGPLRLENSALYGNASTSEAGGIYANVADGQEFILENVTVSGNTAELNGGGLVFAPSASIKYRLTNVTVAENYGKITGGGIYLHNSANSLVLWNSIVSKNTRENGVFDNISAGSVDGSSSNNLIGSGGSGGLVNGFNGNQVGVDDPKLGPLADNGGGTKTHALLPGSLAIDAGSNTAASLLATDQRGAGFLRKIDSGDADSIATVDIGAFEAAGSSNANLTGVTISSGTVTQTDPLTYTANVSYAVDSITVTPTVDITASVTVQSQSVNSGTPSLSIPLTQGATTPISIVVTAEDGTVKNYTLHVTRAAISTNADLSNLVLSAGTWDSPFSSGDTDYTVNVGYEIENVTVTATVADSNATITVNGADVSPGVASSNISLTAGANTPITVVVTAQSGATKTYTMNVNRAAASTNADLSSLVLSAGTWDSPFSPGDTDYAVNVGYGVEKVTVTPTVADSTATITVNGNPVGTGTASGDISLTAGANTPITVVVTAQSGATKTYTINVNRAAASTNADLSSLVLSAGTWDSPFSPGDTDYAVNVGYGVEKVTVTPTVADSTATITVNGNPVGTGAASGDISLTAGANTPITVVVTAQSGATKTFTINVNRAAASTNVDLSNLVLSAGTWDSPFSSGDTDYAVNVGYGVENITVTATVADSNATITVNGADVSPGVASSNISLTAGANTPITVVVTAQSGATKTYTINVNRAAASTNADLSNLVLSAGTWDSPFSSGDTDYAVNVGYGVENITVTATVADSNATITVNGADVSPGVASSNISLTAGANTPITVVVTAQSGATKTYTINVNRAAASTNADLSNLVLSAGTWDSPFSSSDTDYAVNVGYGVDKVTVTPTVADSTATITVNGNPVGTGAASGDISLTAGANTPITVVVTAQSGATKTYTMNVNRAAASTNVDLSNLVLSAGTWDSPFSSGDTDYAVNVGYGVENITVTATVADSNATITVNGNPVGTGAASGDISLTAGANTPITVVV